MDDSVSAADANRHFSKLLRQVREGHTIIVTSHGEPVARITPVDRSTAAATHARDALLRRLKRQKVLEIGTWTRDEIYERDQ